MKTPVHTSVQAHSISSPASSVANLSGTPSSPAAVYLPSHIDTSVTVSPSVTVSSAAVTVSPAAAAAAAGDMTLRAAFGGATPAYWSPEQHTLYADSSNEPELSVRTDIWSWALTALEMFCGGRFWGRQEGHVGQPILQQFLDPNGLNGRNVFREDLHIPVQLVDLLKSCLNQDANARPRSASELVSSLLRIYSTVVGSAYSSSSSNTGSTVATTPTVALTYDAAALHHITKASLATMFVDEGLPADGLKEIEELMSELTQPVNHVYHMIYGACLRGMDRLEEAYEAIQKAIQQAPNQIGYRTQSADILGLLQKNTELINECYKVLELDEDIKFNDYRLVLGVALFAEKRYEEAITVFETGLAFDPDQCMMKEELAKVLIEHRKDYETAIRLFNEVIQSEPNRYESMLWVAICYERLQVYQQAVKFYQMAMAARPNEIQTYQCFANLLGEVGQYAPAIALLTKALELDPNHIASINSLANIQLRLGQLDVAFSLYDKILSVDCNHANALSNMAQVLLKKEGTCE
eukprot:GILK01007231.1.p1 GENE.GILK01007231.1~~GILK01007231.1.p1  ORF type:complete len:524 (-),score=124.23 GILK01007231.1:468-2039(-)